MKTRAPVLLHELVEGSAGVHPDRPAVTHQDRTLSYSSFPEVRDIVVDDPHITSEAFETLATLTAFVGEPRLLVMPEPSVPGVASWR